MNDRQTATLFVIISALLACITFILDWLQGESSGFMAQISFFSFKVFGFLGLVLYLVDVLQEQEIKQKV